MALVLRNKRIFGGPIPTAPTALCTAAGVSWRIMGANLVNNSPVEETYTLWAPAPGGSPADGSLQTPTTFSIPANSRKDVAELLRLDVEDGGAVFGQASTADVLILTLSASEFTEI
jgi:hypothetical protein